MKLPHLRRAGAILALGLCASVAGCRTPEAAPPPPLGWEEVRSGALRQLGTIRARDILRRQALRLAEAEKLRSELDDLIGEFSGGEAAGRRSAGSDPRYFYGLEAISYCRLLLLRPEAVAPEEFILPAARAEVEFEVLEKLARLEMEREARGPGGSADSRDAELELSLDSGIPVERLRRFDFSSLPGAEGICDKPGRGGPVGAEPLRVAQQLFELPGRAAKSPDTFSPAEAEKLIAREFALLRRLAAETSGDASASGNSAAQRFARRLAAARLRELDAVESMGGGAAPAPSPR